MSKVTFIASPDIAFVKYWGNKDDALRIPENDSISMSLNGLETITTVEFSSNFAQDSLMIDGVVPDLAVLQRTLNQVDLLRSLAQVTDRIKIVSQSNFPPSTGLSSSASGFAALTLAVNKALRLNLTTKQLSSMARRGSGSACRCVNGGFVIWHSGSNHANSYSETLFPSNHWLLYDLVSIVSESKKEVGSSEGHYSAHSSKFYPIRLLTIAEKLKQVRQYLAKKDFTALGELVEMEALEFHSILFTSRPSLLMWHAGTMNVMQEVRAMRRDGLEAYFTMNTGFNVHVLTLPVYLDKVRGRLEQLSLVDRVIVSQVGDGPLEVEKHLF